MSQPASWKQPLHRTRRRLSAFWYRANPRLTTIAVTGSYGKTTTTLAIDAVLAQKYSTLKTKLNLDTVYNLPITLLKIRPHHRQIILELGVDHRGEMASYLELVKPQIAVLTGITPVHTDPELLGSVQGIIEEKGKLLESLSPEGIAILNQDDPHVVKMAAKTKAKVYWYSLKNPQADLFAHNIQVTLQGTSFTLSLKSGRAGKRSLFEIRTGLIGRHFVQACLAAAAVGYLQGVTPVQIKKGLAQLKPQEGRVSSEKGPLGTILINDALRANPASTLAGLQVLADLPTSKKRVAVLGEMGELGKSAVLSHQAVGREAAGLNIDNLVCVGPLQKYAAAAAVKAGMKKNQVYWVANVHEAAAVLKTLLSPGDLLYLKGSLMRHLERVVLILNSRKVGCRVVSCQFYHQCLSCPYLAKGLKSKDTNNS